MEPTQKHKTYFFQQQLVNMLRWEPHPPPWTRMILCATATCVPLLIGLCCGQLVISIYGALTGYILGLSDHSGPFKHRLWTITLTFLLLIAGFTVGHLLQGNWIIYLILFTALVYWLGILAGEGAELEKALLFTTIALVSAYFASPLTPAIIPLLWFYTGVGYLCLIIGIPLLAIIRKPSPESITGFRTALKKTLTLRKEKHLYAVTYVVFALLSVWITYYFHIERGYWVTITVLLVMKPDQNPAFYRAFQRSIGTLLAVGCVDILLQLEQDPRWLIPVIIGCALGVPWAIKKNYWLMTFLVTIMVVLLLELVSPRQEDLHTPFIRLIATLLGCGLGLAGMLISKMTGSQNKEAVS